MEEEKDHSVLNINGTFYRTNLSKKFKGRIPYQAPDSRFIVSYIPGTILDINIKPGQAVSKGDNLMVLDAMKMQNQLKCKTDGVVKNILVKKGDKVSKGTVLIEME